MNSSKKYCMRCILPESYPGISFDDEGICNYCLDYKPVQNTFGKQKLLEVLTSQQKTGKYDCVVPISGGKDSTYILYYVVKQLKLKPIAVTYNSGFQHWISIDNTRSACGILSVPLIEIQSPVDIRTKMLRESLLVSKKVGGLWHQCGNCEAILRNMSISTAKTYGAPFVIWGSSAVESGDDKTYEWYRNFASAQARFRFSFLNNAVSKFNVLLKSPQRIHELPRKAYSYMGYHTIKYYFYSICERMALKFPLRYALKPHAIPPFSSESCTFVHFFDYVDWNSINNLEVLQKELNWKHPIDQESRWDCAIHCLSNHASLKKFGISDDGKNYCNFIRENKVDREDAMKNEIHLRQSVARECEVLINRIGLEGHKIPWGSE